MSVINRILLLMEKENINARKLTRDLELSNSSITEWKKGKAKPSIEAVVKIAGYFGVTTDYLLLDEREEMHAGEQALWSELPEAEQRRGDVTDETGICPDGRWKAGEESRSPEGEAEEKNRSETFREYQTDPMYRIQADGLSGEDRRLLDCYHRLAAKDREYIRCKMIVLEREGDIRGES